MLCSGRGGGPEGIVPRTLEIPYRGANWPADPRGPSLSFYIDRKLIAYIGRYRWLISAGSPTAWPHLGELISWMEPRRFVIHYNEARKKWAKAYRFTNFPVGGDAVVAGS